MQRKILIAFLILFNLVAMYLFHLFYHLSFGIIVMPMGEWVGETLANTVGQRLLILSSIGLIVIAVLDFLLLKKGIKSKRPLLIASGFLIMVSAVSLISYCNSKNNFIAFQKSRPTLGNELNFNEVVDIEILENGVTRTIKKSRIDDLKIGLRTADFKKGFFKYAKTYRILLKPENGKTDTLLSNGTLIQLGEKYFELDENINEYLW